MTTVEQHMGQVRDAVKTCADATTYEGKVSARVIITPAGAASATLTQASGEAKSDECVVQAFSGVTFPTRERGQNFVYSFTFAPPTAGPTRRATSAIPSGCEAT